MKRVLEALFASFLFHFLLLLGVILLAPRFENKAPEVIEIALAPPSKSNLQKKSAATEKQIVRQALVPDRMKAPEDETLARFLSEQKQRVKQETQAAENGMTENRSNTSAQKVPQKQQEQKTPTKQQANKEQPQEKAKDGYRTVDISKELNEMNRLNEGRSMVGEALPTDVKVGSFTALNTDRYLFYTFYARIEELVRFRWESRVQQAIDSFDKITALNAGGKNWNTQVEFLLDRKGVLQKAIIMKESGMKYFDAAAINAFKEARIFPNPPQEMVQDDGYIHLEFTFTVNYRPPVLVDRN